MMSDLQTVFTDNLNRLLKEQDKLPVDLARALNIPPATVYTWTLAQKLPRAGNLDRIAKYLGVTRTELITEHQDTDHWYLNEETRKVAQEIAENKDLSLLFNAARTASPDDLKTAHSILLALKRKEEGRDD